MTIRPLRYYGDPVLRLACTPVSTFDDGVKRLAADLMETVALLGRAGLAAPQIGVPLRVFSYLVDERHGYVINPQIVELSAQQQDGDEGCLSIPELWFPLPRAQRAVVGGVDVRDAPVVVEGEGLMARCLQHEVDHLDGRVYLDRLAPDQRREAMRAIRSAEWF